MIFLAYIELLLFAICAFTVFYLLVYAIAATGNRTDKYSESRVKHRFAILIPAYQDDDYIPYTVKSFLQQEYPIDCYDIIVISDHLKPETNRQLAQYPITLLQARFKKSSKMKSVKAAMSQLQEGQYDIVLIMNADNVVDTNFLEVVNNTYASGSNAIQTHRIYQERPSNVSILNAITDEINKKSSKMKSVKAAMSQLQEGQYDIVLIMNADNVVDTNFLEVVNNTYASGSNAIQTHRIYQERPNNVSILNAITDEINNSILRAGHVNLGLSASLNGSGTAIDFTWFKENIRHLKDDDDEKVIESLLLRERIYVEYLNNTHVYALKNSGKKKFYTQHGTWIKTQYYSLFTNIGNLPGAILSGKFDYADRILQWFIFPRTILLGILLLFSFLSVYFHWSACLKWWGLLLTFLLTMAIATPNYLVDSKFNKAMKAIPFLAAGMIFNMLLRKKK